jgi:membrane protease YdiL (CAAX protease family)
MSPDPFWLDHVLVALLAVVFPVRASTFGYRRLLLADEGSVPAARLTLYRQGMTLQWVLAAATLGLWVWRGRAWAALGLVPRVALGSWITLGILLVAVAAVLVQRRNALHDPETLASVRHRLRHVERLLPRSPGELKWFYRLSITAGVCEELLYRGYLIWYLSHWLGPYGGAAVAALVFGFGHLYQGPRGILTTTLAGVVLTAIYLGSGSLYLGMVAHALGDMHSGQLACVAFGSPPPQAVSEAPPQAGPELEA